MVECSSFSYPKGFELILSRTGLTLGLLCTYYRKQEMGTISNNCNILNQFIVVLITLFQSLNW